jgi:hypothetical protein
VGNQESCETCSVRLDSAWSPRVILAVASDEDQSLGAQSDRRGRRQHLNRLVFALVAHSHRQHNAKLCVATHHASICFGSLRATSWSVGADGPASDRGHTGRRARRYPLNGADMFQQRGIDSTSERAADSSSDLSLNSEIEPKIMRRFLLADSNSEKLVEANVRGC